MNRIPLKTIIFNDADYETKWHEKKRSRIEMNEIISQLLPLEGNESTRMHRLEIPLFIILTIIAEH